MDTRAGPRRRAARAVLARSLSREKAVSRKQLRTQDGTDPETAEHEIFTFSAGVKLVVLHPYCGLHIQKTPRLRVGCCHATAFTGTASRRPLL